MTNVLYWEATKTCGTYMAIELCINCTTYFPNGMFITYYGFTEQYIIDIIKLMRLSQLTQQEYFVKEKVNKTDEKDNKTNEKTDEKINK